MIRNVETQSSLNVSKVKDSVQHVKWNYNGSLLATATKDKLIRIVDPRAPKVVGETLAHEGSKGMKIEWMGGSVQPGEFMFSAGTGLG